MVIIVSWFYLSCFKKNISESDFHIDGVKLLTLFNYNINLKIINVFV